MLRNLLVTLVAAIPLAGCVYYECDDGCWEDWDDWDWEECEDWDDCDPDPCEEDDPCEGEEEEEAVDPYGLYLTPFEVEQGDRFIASVRAVEELDLTTVAEVFIDGEVAIEGMDARANEVLLFVGVSPEAEPGPAEIYVTLDDQSLIQLEQPLMIFEDGSGHDAGTSDDGSGC